MLSILRLRFFVAGSVLVSDSLRLDDSLSLTLLSSDVLSSLLELDVSASSTVSSTTFFDNFLDFISLGIRKKLSQLNAELGLYGIGLVR